MFSYSKIRKIYLEYTNSLISSVSRDVSLLIRFIKSDLSSVKEIYTEDSTH